MKLILRKPDSDLEGIAKLVVVSGDVKFWEMPTKETEVTAREFPTTGLPKTMWVEARAISGKVRDIVIEMQYKDKKDTVKATGIWADLLSFRNTPGADLSADADGDAIKNTFAGNGGALGMLILPLNPGSSSHNNVELGFTVRPAGIGSEPGIGFDISRRRETQGVTFKDGVRTVQPPDPYPGGDELPNDDGNGNDEDVDPKNDHIFSIDDPGISLRGRIQPATVYRFFRERNFQEFVRVRMDGTRPTGNRIEGSRCSNMEPWFSHEDIDKKAGAVVLEVRSSSSGTGNPAFSPLPN